MNSRALISALLRRAPRAASTSASRTEMATSDGPFGLATSSIVLAVEIVHTGTWVGPVAEAKAAVGDGVRTGCATYEPPATVSSDAASVETTDRMIPW